MTALRKIQDAGFILKINNTNGELLIDPASKLTPSQRDFIKRHKSNLVLELRKTEDPDLAPSAPTPDRQSVHGVLAANDDTHTSPPPLLSIGELLMVLDGDSSVAQATAKLGELLARPAQERVCCGRCLHFERDTIGDGHGVGGCKISAPTLGCRWPNQQRYCGEFTAI